MYGNKISLEIILPLLNNCMIREQQNVTINEGTKTIELVICNKLIFI